MQLILVWLAVTTWYIPTDFSDPVLLYGGHSPTPECRWVAVDVYRLLDGDVELGDVLYIEFVDHPQVSTVLAVRDTGPLGDYYIEDFPELPIVLDIPYRAWPAGLEGLRSARVRIVNITALDRAAAVGDAASMVPIYVPQEWR